jgi:general secretion pathway protein A
VRTRWEVCAVYLEFFRLKDRPFSLAPDPRFIFMSESHREALAHLLYGVQEGHGFIEVVGQVGTGKTTLCRTLLEQIGGQAEIGFIFNPSPSEIELLTSINREFGLPTQARTRSELVQELNQFLLRQKQAGRRVVLVIDEAQNLDPAVLEQVRLLSNLETDSDKLLQIVLFGQPELDENLGRSDLRQLRQRITVRWRLRPFGVREVGQYLEHRLAVAGHQGSSPFSAGAVRAIRWRSGGIPRLINAIADRALLLAFSRGRARVSARLALRAANELPASEFAGWRATTGLSPSTAAGLVSVGVLSGVLFAALVPAVDAGSRWAQLVGLRRSLSEEVRSLAELEPRLRALGPARSSKLALDAVLERWGLEPLRAATPDPSYYPEALRQATRLRVFPTDAALDQILTLDLPAVLEIEIEPGERRWTALAEATEAGEVVLQLGRERFRMSNQELQRIWNGRAFFVWNNFNSLPALEPGMRGNAVRWVQSRLIDLGFLHPGDASGDFDELTAEAVRRFQQGRALAPTGSVGPETLIALYQALEYSTPRLRSRRLES